MKKKIKIHPIIKKLQEVENYLIKERYWFALPIVDETINKISQTVASINASCNNKEGNCKGWS